LIPNWGSHGGGFCMDQHTRTCHVCGTGVPLSDLEAHRVLLLLKRCYCRTCTTALESALPRPRAAPPRRDRFGARLLLGLATASASLALLLYLLGAVWKRGL